MKKVLFITIIFLLITQFIYAKETFYSALESKESVEKEGGTVIGGEFDTGKLGKGFKSVTLITMPLLCSGLLTRMERKFPPRQR